MPGMNWQTHDVTNQVDELGAYDLLATDLPLQEALATGGAQAHAPLLADYAAKLARPQSFEWGDLANRHVPTLQTHDGRGRRIDRVDFHPAWHELMALCRGQGFASLAHGGDQPGRWVAMAAGLYLHGQVEAGTLCPLTMTQAAIPVLQKEPALWAQLRQGLLSTDYDARDLPIADKRSLWIGMGMTEKQGGSDVRSNTTTATPIGPGGRGGEYLLRGHKWFYSAPMSDAHLVVARTPDAGLGCFFVPRWRPDGSKNPVQIQRLKDKLGNRSNSGSEVEFLDAWGVLVGEEGRGIPTIIEMATYTRLNCVIGNASVMRQALVQAVHYARHRAAFGKCLADQPLMMSVLADLALESEAAMHLMVRLAQAFEHPQDVAQRAWVRIMTPAAKFWVCKRAVEFCGEAMEVFGGNGYVEDGVMARLFREAPVNSIWEGSGNVMCLDLIRAASREPAALLALLDELATSLQGEHTLLAELDRLRTRFALPADALEPQGRRLAERLVLLAQAGLLRTRAPEAVYRAFVDTRLDPAWGHVFGAVDSSRLPVQWLLQRALPA